MFDCPEPPPPPPQPAGSDLHPVMLPGIVSPEDCERLVQLHRTTVRASGDETTRHVHAYLGGLSDHVRELLGFAPALVPGLDHLPAWLGGVVTAVNRDQFRFTLLGDCYPSSGCLEAHDAARTPNPWHVAYTLYPEADGIAHKLVGIVQLTDPAEYDGGEVEVFTGQRVVPALRERGSLCLFPAFQASRRAPVTRGAAHTLYVHAIGPVFR